MGIAGRVRRLEYGREKTWPCLICGSKGQWVVSTIQEGEPVPKVEGCPGCGKAQQIVVMYCEETAMGVPRSRLAAS